MPAVSTAVAACPECAAEVTVPVPATQNEIVECQDCRSELEVIWVTPIVLALAPPVEEDWGE
jgi:alpha-aminoadipate/glutamate carrier protein LysW